MDKNNPEPGKKKPMSKANKPKVAKEPKPKAPSQKSSLIDLATNMIAIINGADIVSKHPQFQREWVTITDTMGKKIVAENLGKGEIIVRYDDLLVDEILQYCHYIKGGKGIWKIDHNDAWKIFNQWKALTQAIPNEDIKPVLFKSDDPKGFCWKRLDFDPEPGETPTFDEILGRMNSNQEAFKAWIWSIFEPKSELQDYVWLHGHGQNGKGRISSWLREVIGQTFISQTVPKGETRFFAAEMHGKRLAVFADCKDYNFVTTGLFRSLTGDDPQKLERKGQDPFTAKLICKYLFSSNDKPGITSITADMRRVICIEVAPFDEAKLMPTRAYDARLNEETSAFLHKCRQVYRELCPQHSRIPKDTASIEDVAASNEDTYEYFCDRFIQRKEEGTLFLYEMQAAYELLKIQNPHVKKQYKDYIERTYKVTMGRTKPPGEDARKLCYRGLELSETGRRLLGEHL